jgi:hypothetical protein
MRISKAITLIAIAIASNTIAIRGEVPDSDPDVLIQSIRKAHQAFRAIPMFLVDSSMHYEHFAGQRNFSFETIDVVWKRAGFHQRLTMKGFMQKEGTLFRDYGWNGKIGTGVEMFMNERGGSYSTSFIPHTGILYCNYFVNFLNYPDAHGSIGKLVSPQFEPFAKASTWLPKSLTLHKASLVISNSRDGSENAHCIRIEVPGQFVYWFDPALGYALRRHDVLAAESKILKSKTVFGSFVQVSDIWLPTRIVHEDYAVHDEESSHLDISDLEEGTLLSRKTLVVNRFSTDSISTEEFVVPSPNGYERPVQVKTLSGTNFSGKDMHYLHSNEVFNRPKPKPPTRWFDFSMIAVVLLACVAFAMVLSLVRLVQDSGMDSEPLAR